MKKIILTMVIAMSVIACKVDSKNKVDASDAEKVQGNHADVGFTVVNDKSVLTWKGFKPTGSHDGTVGIEKGKIMVDGNELTGGKFIFDMNSIVCLDIPADDEYNAKLVGHLKAADFFDVEKFPTALFEITNVVKAADKVNVSGNLTVKGITKNITIPATFGAANGFATLKSDTFKIDRTDFGIQYKSTKLADIVKEKSIDDLIEMSFDIIAKK